MKKIGILTFHGSHNYGAMLQAYALQQCVSSLKDVDVQILDYRTKQMLDNYAVFKKSFSARSVLLNFLTLPIYRQAKRRYDRYEAFIRKYLKTSKRYNSADEMSRLSDRCDVYITGSDQVWNTASGIKDVYFLSFVPDAARCVSYAASFGDQLPIEKYSDEIAALLRRFDLISVRETEAATYVSSLLGKDCAVSIDPVFLLSGQEWRSTFSGRPPLDEPYILCYSIGEVGEIPSILAKLKAKTGYKVVALKDSLRSQIQCDISVYDAGPEEFLNFFASASIVVTNSFHGTAFSLLLERPFYSVKRSAPSARITSLLSLFRLPERFIATADEIRNLETDFVQTEAIRKRQVELSRKYLEECIFGKE